MAVSVNEALGSGETTDAGKTDLALLEGEKRYHCKGSSDEQTILTAVRATAPTTLDGMNRGQIVLTPTGPDLWDAVVRYRSPESEMDEGDSVVNFSTGGGSAHITQSLATSGTYVASGYTATDFKGAIGVSSTGVEGCDVIVPKYEWSETHIMAADDVDSAYIATLYALTGKVNNALWNGWAADEVLFKGAEGSPRDDGKIEITFHFAASPNETDLTVGGITGIAKKGWEYLWVLYEEEDDATGKRMFPKPVVVKVEQVYERGSFAGLGI